MKMKADSKDLESDLLNLKRDTEENFVTVQRFTDLRGVVRNKVNWEDYVVLQTDSNRAKDDIFHLKEEAKRI